MSLPDHVVTAIFKRMLILYGSRFSDMWAGVDPVAMRCAWAEALGNLDNESIKVALAACANRPYAPNLPEFIALCSDAMNRKGTYRAIEQPRIDREAAKKRIADIAVLYGNRRKQ